MPDTDAYDEVYALFACLADRYDELSDEQHVFVMEALNAFADVAPPGSPGLVAYDTESVVRLVRRIAEGLTRLIERAPDGGTALCLSRAHALLVSSMAA